MERGCGEAQPQQIQWSSRIETSRSILRVEAAATDPAARDTVALVIRGCAPARSGVAKNIAPGRDIGHIKGLVGEMAEWFKAHAWKMRNTVFSSHHHSS